MGTEARSVKLENVGQYCYLCVEGWRFENRRCGGLEIHNFGRHTHTGKNSRNPRKSTLRKTTETGSLTRTGTFSNNVFEYENTENKKYTTGMLRILTREELKKITTINSEKHCRNGEFYTQK